MIRSALLRGVSAGALTFSFLPCAALAQTADTAAQADSGAIPLPPVDVAGSGSAGDAGAGAGDPTGTGPGESGGRFTGYNAVDAIAATKTDTPILQTPFSVEVVTRETMDDQQDITIQQALVGNVSSIYQNGASYGGALPLFNIRGFDNGTNSGGQIYYNGLQVSGADPNLANVQSLQVLKGPAAMLFGRVEPGGIIWVQSKRPLDTPYYSFQEQAGAFGLTRTTVDATGPLTTDKNWLYRFNADFSNTNQFTDFVYSKDILLVPAITYHPIEQFNLFVEGMYRKTTQVYNYSNDIVLPGANAPAPGVPLSRFLGDPALVDVYPNVTTTRQLYYDWTFDISPSWSLTNRLLYQDLSTASGISQPIANASIFGLPPTNVLLFNYWGNGWSNSLASNIDLKGKFVTGPLQHAVLFGTDFQNFENPPSLNVEGAYTPILNIYNPKYFPSGFSFTDPNNFAYYNHEASQWKGVYAQDMISALNDSIHLLIGGRYDWADSGNLVNSYPQTPTLAEPLNWYEDRAFSPRIGLLYQPLPWLSFYGNYSKGFGNSNGVNPVDHTILPPQLSRQWEGGAKAEFFDKRLSVSMAFYDIYKSNIPTPDPTNPNNTILIGLAESTGVEFDMTGKINDNWSLIANYSHEDVRVVTGQPYNPLTEVATEAPVAGNWLASVPANAGNLWVKYSADGQFQGLSIMGGVNVIGSSWGDNANSFKINQYTLVNGGVSYRFPWVGAKITAQVNVTNLFNTAYYVSASSPLQITSGTPRSVLGSLRVEF